MKPTRLYIDVLWKHHYGDDSVGLLSELGSDRSELRKLGFFRDRTVDAADSGCEISRTRLGLGAVFLSERNQPKSSVKGLFITEDEFEVMWLGHARIETVALGKIARRENLNPDDQC